MLINSVMRHYMDKLFSLEMLELFLTNPDPRHNGVQIAFAKELADTLRENERLKDINNQLRESIKPIAAWPIVANGRIAGDENQWNDIVVKARQVLSNYTNKESYDVG